MSKTSYLGFATGAVRHEPSDKDYHAHKIPGVAAMAAAMAVTPVPSADLSPFVKQIYDQGQVPACVCYSTALMKSLQDRLDRSRWQTYDALECYHANGGNDQEGLPARDVLEYVKDTGMLVQGGTARCRIGSYAFVKQDPALFVSTLKAAIVANQPCVVALRLPEVFGWNSSGDATDAYHQMCYVGFDSEDGGNAIFGNSWSAAWGRNGFCRVPFDYLTANSFQGGDCYAYTAIDAVDPSLAPDPLPEITVGGYLGATGSVPMVRAGAALQIVGSGFLAPGLQASLGWQLEILDRQERLLTVRLPTVPQPAVGPVLITCGSQSVTGPLLVVVPASE